MILGLDVSTSCTGMAVINSHGTLVHYCAIETKNKKKFPSMFSKIKATAIMLEDIKSKYDIKSVYIEEPLNKFSSGKSTAKTIVTLARYNGMVSFASLLTFGIEPIYIPFVSARALNRIPKPDKKKGENIKKIVLDLCLLREPSFEVQYTSKKNPKPFFFDIADAIIIARAGYIKEIRS